LLRNIKDFEVELAKLRTAYNNGNGTITKEEYQKQIRNSPLWDTMVEQFGEDKAREMLKEFRCELRE